MLQCIAMCCSALQCVAVHCNVLQCVAVRCSVLQRAIAFLAAVGSMLQRVAMCCNVLQCAIAVLAAVVSVCDMTDSSVCHDSFMCVTSRIRMCDMTALLNKKNVSVT